MITKKKMIKEFMDVITSVLLFTRPLSNNKNMLDAVFLRILIATLYNFGNEPTFFLRLSTDIIWSFGLLFEGWCLAQIIRLYTMKYPKNEILSCIIYTFLIAVTVVIFSQFYFIVNLFYSEKIKHGIYKLLRKSIRLAIRDYF